MQKYWNTVQDEKGNPREGASVAVQQSSVNASIFSDQAGLIAKTNPLTTDSRGYFEFYAAAGEYDLSVSGSGFSTYTITDGALIGLPSGDVTFIQSGTGAISETVQSRGRWWQLITDYMSDGDRASLRAGSTVNIDTAMANAHGALPTNGGDIILPPGKHKLTATPPFTKRVRILGMGAPAINAAGTGSTVIIKDAAMTTSLIKLSIDGSGIENIELEGENGNTGDGLTIAAGRCFAKGVSVYSMGQDGIRISDSSGALNCNLWFLENVRSKSNGRDGLRIDDSAATAGSANANGGTAVHLDLQSNTGSGLYLGNAQLNTFVGAVSQSNTEYGYRLTANADNNMFFGGDPEANTTKDIILEAGALENRFFGLPIASTAVTDNGTRTFLMLADTTFLNRGLQFPASQVASSNVNTLDDYEEGTWTPDFTFDTAGDIAITWSVQVGTYTKIGRLVMAQFSLTSSAFTYTTASGSARLTGWPFTSANISGNDAVGVLKWRGITKASYTQVSVRLSANSTVARLIASGSGQADATIATGDVPTGGVLAFSGTLMYQTA